MNWPLSDQFQNIHNVLDKLMKYFDGVKNVLELIITNKNEANTNKRNNKSSNSDSKSNSPDSFAEEVSNYNIKYTPYFEETDKYIEALSQFVSRFHFKEKINQDKIFEIEARLKLKEEEFQRLKLDLKQFKQN